ncbi:MAG: DNA polymerase/3'-5' exonuclease PolX [Acidobacteria bacterium]|nr:MAG: DNA polymerase/3'-5' exonuclease PolX [Acidobacteriota bacterium]MCL4287878.1 DNA polymerase/3'-5' exonuclease PolX [Thermoleophilia bacterium]
MHNAEIAAAFRELGTLYELDGANRFRVLAYRDAARTIAESPVPVGELARAGRATELEGIGDTIQEKIVALLDEGEIPAARKLKQRLPATLVELTRLPGVGAKTVRRIYDETGIATPEGLRAAAAAGELRGLRGLGPKFEQNVLAALDRIEAEGDGERRLLSDVREIGAELVAGLRSHAAAGEVILAGSARRWADTCKDIDIVATASDPTALGHALIGHDLIGEAGNPSANGVRARTHNGIAVDLRIVPAAELGNLLQHLTGSAAHNVKLRERAQRMGLSVSEHGIAEIEGDAVTRCADEAGVYARLGLDYIEPELREGRDEISLAERGELPELVTVADIRGDLHCHTTLSDGRNTLAEMAAAARDRGYAYLAITDHSATHGFGDDVQAGDLLRRVDEVAAYNAEHGSRRFRLLAGSEVNIGADGGLDYPDDVLERLDWVIASVHTSFRMSKRRMTDRIVAAVRHPLVSCLGHPTGRLLLRREPYDLDVDAVIAAAAEAGTMIEINGNPSRRDLGDRHARLAAEAGVPIVCTTDAHRTRTLANMDFAVATARRAGLSAKQVANTRTWAQLRKLL